MPTAVTSLISTSQHQQQPHSSRSLRSHAVFLSAAAVPPTTSTFTMTSPGNARGPSGHNKNVMILRIPGPLEGDSGRNDDVKEAAALISARRDSAPAPASPPLRHHPYPHLNLPHHQHRFQSPGADFTAADNAGTGPELLLLKDPLPHPRHAGGRCDVDGRILTSSGDAGKGQFENNNTTSRGDLDNEDGGEKRNVVAVLPTGDVDDKNDAIGDRGDQNKTLSSSSSSSSSQCRHSTIPRSMGSDTKTILVIPSSRDSGAAIESASRDRDFDGCDISSGCVSETTAEGAAPVKSREDHNSCIASSTDSSASGDGESAGDAAKATADDKSANAASVSSSEPEIVSVLKRKDSAKKRDGVGRSVSVTEPSGDSREEVTAASADKSTSDVCDAETIPTVSNKRRISFPADSVLTAVIQDGDAGELLRILTGRHGPGLVAGETGRGVDVQQSNHVGLTALHHAVLANNLDAAKLLLCHGADVNAQDVHGFSPLHTAAACGFLPLASLLVLFGADVFSMTSECELPVDLARDVEVVRVLTSEMTRLIHQELWLTSLLRARAEEAWLLVRKLLACVLLFVLYVAMGLRSSWSRKRSKTD